MKRSNFTLNEMLAVIAIIGILAALIFPSLSYARNRARLTSCASNQGQLAKLIQSGMNRAKDQFISGSDDAASKLWSTSLYERNILQSLTVARCPEMIYTTPDNQIDNSTARAEVYGVVFADGGKLDFRSSKLRRTAGGDTVPPSSLMLGGCASATVLDPVPDATLDILGGDKLAAVHRGEVNVFFLDGSVATVLDKDFDLRSFYYPLKDNSAAAEVPDGTLLKF